jgi:hypothetical protein
MKTQINISNLKRATLTVLTSLLITAGSFTLASEGCKSPAAMERLDAFVNRAEQSMYYMAPATTETSAISAESERLEAFAAAVEASLKYTASAYDETNEVAPALERLEMLAAATQASLKYQAPGVCETEITPEMERLEWMAAATEASLKYRAPVIYDTIDDNNNTGKETETMLATTTK